MRPEERLAPEWDALADRLGATPFHRPGWVLAWSRAFGRGPPAVVAVRRAGELAGILPLERVGRSRCSASDVESPLFGPLAVDADAAHDLARAALAERPRSISLWMVDPADPAAVAFERASAAAGYRLVRRTMLRSPVLHLDGTWEAYVGGRSRRRFAELRRRRRRLEELGRVTFDVVDGREGLSAALEEGFAVEGSGWKEERGTAIRSRPAARRFYTEVARWAAGRGWLRLGSLRLDGRPLAFDICLEWDGTHALVKTGYDPAFRRYAPGIQLRAAMIERAFSLGLSAYDFLGTDDPWKREWTEEVRPRVLLHAFAPSPAGTVWWAAEAFGRPAARRVRRSVRRLFRRRAD